MIGSVLGISIMVVVVAVSLIPESFAQERSTVLYFDPLPSSVNAGDTIVFSGYLATADGYVVQNAVIYINDDVSFGLDDTLGTVVTDANGEFYETWAAQARDGGGAYDFYAVFEGSDGFDHARSATYSVTVVQSQSELQIFATTLYLDPLPRQAYAGDALAFSGILETADGRPVQNAQIQIKDDVRIGSDDLLDTTVTDVNGEFYVSWAAQPRSGGGAYDFYAVFEGSDGFDHARSATYSVTVVQSQPEPQIFATTLYLDPLQRQAYAGDALAFSGILETADGRPVQNAQIQIKDDVRIGSDDLLDTTVTDVNGEFYVSWAAQPRSGGGAYDFYAVFEEAGQFEGSRSATRSVEVSRIGGSITLDRIPTSARVGERVDFSGTLRLDRGSPEGAVVYIKDEDFGSRDELLATAYTEASGRFSTYWIADYADFDDTVDIYAVFEGYGDFARLTTCDPTPTGPGGGLCLDTLSLRIYGDLPSPEPPGGGAGPEPPQPPSPVPPDDAAADGYMELNYAMNLLHNPRVAIVPHPDAYEEVRSHIVPAQEGVMTWTAGMERRHGGIWNVDFEVVFPGKAYFDKRPDVIINLITPDQRTKCERDTLRGWAPVHRSSPTETVSTHVCSSSSSQKRSNAEVGATAAHEFIHAMGLGHTFGIDGDLMCSVEAAGPTCPFFIPKSKVPSALNLDAVAEIYGIDGFKDPNNQFEYKYKFYAVERDSGSEAGPVGGTGPEQVTRPSTYTLMAGDNEFTILYNAGSNSIVAMEANLESRSLVIEADVAGDGEIVIALPRHLIDSRNADGTDATYIVLVNGWETWVTETADSAARTLTIPVSAGAQAIEIFGTQAIPEFGAPGIQNGPVGGTDSEQITRPSTYMLMAGGDEFAIPYNAGSNSIVAMEADLESGILVIEVDVAGDGEIVIALPRHLIDSRNADGTDATYIVLVNGWETWFTETADSAARTLTIPVSAGAQAIEIFSTQAIPEFGAHGIQNGPVGGTGPEQVTRPSTYMLMAGGDEFAIPYNAGSNSIVAVEANLESRSLVIEVDVVGDGEIVIALPRHLIDAKNADGTDDTYIVLVDGEDAWVTETADSAARTLTIPISAGAREIEIFGTFIVPEFGTIAILILAAAVVSIIVVSGRTRLSAMPKH